MKAIRLILGHGDRSSVDGFELVAAATAGNVGGHKRALANGVGW